MFNCLKGNLEHSINNLVSWNKGKIRLRIVEIEPSGVLKLYILLDFNFQYVRKSTFKGFKENTPRTTL
jgi:hypothetical protein